jgi:hypothetical protein
MSTRRLLVSIFALTLVAIPTFGQDAGKVNDQMALKMTHDLTTSVISADIDTLNRVLTDDFTKTAASNGRVQTKAEWVGGLKSGRQHYQLFEFSNEKVGVYDGSAIVTASVHFRVVNGTNPAADNYEVVTTTWVQQGGMWRCASWVSYKDPAVAQPAPAAK